MRVVAIDEPIYDVDTAYCESSPAFSYDVEVLDQMPSVVFTFSRDKSWLALLDLPVECGRDGWDGYDAAPLSRVSFERAAEFLKLLPNKIPSPEVVVDNDGDVCFEWYFSKDNRLAMTFSGPESYYFVSVRGGMPMVSKVDSSILALRCTDRALT